jgi:hypothetical protein
VRVKAPLNYVGPLEFEFTVSDGKGGQTKQKAIGSVEPVNDNPHLTISNKGVNNNARGLDRQVSTFRVEAWDAECQQTTSLTIAKNPLIGSATLSKPSSHHSLLFEITNDVKDRYFFGKTTAADLTTYSSRGGRSSAQEVWVKATDSAGGSSTKIVSFTAFCDPVIIDLDNDGLEFIDLDHSTVRFVTDDSGQARRIAWVGADDGILAYDVDGDGRINRFDEIAFGSHVDPQNPGMSDLQALQHTVFDSNQDSVFDASDDKWWQFRLWRDRNSNGKSDEGELQTLQEAGLRQLYLNGNVLNRFEGPDALVRGYTRVVTNDGRLLQAADVWLNVDDGSRAEVHAPAPAREATAMEADRLAALLKQLADTPPDSNHAPLLYGYLPTQYADEGDFFRLEIAPNFFIDPDLGDILEFSATLADGSPLPDWLSFDPQRLRFEGMPSGEDAAQLQVVLRATDPLQSSTETVFNLIVSPALTLPEEFVSLDDSLVSAQQNLSWNALLPMDEWLAATSAESLSEVDAWAEVPLMDQSALGLEDTPVFAGAAITAPEHTIAQLFQDFIQGTSGDDAYDFHPGDGWRSLQDPGGADLIRIELDHAESTLQFERQGSDLSLSVAGTHDGLLIAGWYERNESGAAVHQIERFQLNDGRTLVASDLEQLIAAHSVTINYSSGQFWR